VDPSSAGPVSQLLAQWRAGDSEALNALVQVGHPKLIAVLADALKGSDETLKQQAFTILAGRADRESEELRPVFRS
jgi:hypothetical protein